MLLDEKKNDDAQSKPTALAKLQMINKTTTTPDCDKELPLKDEETEEGDE